VTRNLQSSAPKFTCYFRIFNSGLFGKITHADYFLSTDSTKTTEITTEECVTSCIEDSLKKGLDVMDL